MASALKQAKDFAKFSLKQSKELASYNNTLERENVAIQNEYNKALAKENRDWQEMMSNTAHQREIADLKAAGLNPVLSITGGNGATVPSGSSASVSKPNVDMSLPAKVMDMAMSQLSSATSLQTTAMQTANALTIAREQIANQWLQHITPSGNSFSGQVSALPQTLNNFLVNIAKAFGLDPSVFTGNGSSGSGNGSSGSGNGSSGSGSSNSRTRYNGYTVKQIMRKKGQDIFELIDALNSPEFDKTGSSSKTIRTRRWRNFWKDVRDRSYSNSSRR